MKKQFVFTMAALAALAFSVTSCKKDNDTPTPNNNTNPTAKTKTQLLTANNWKAVSMVSGGIDLYNYMEACEKDNFITLKADGAFINDEGATKCDAKDPQVENGSWKFISNEAAIVLDNQDTCIIQKLTSDTMKLEVSFVDDEGERSTMLTTFVPKK